MIKEGCLDNVEEIYGMHNYPKLPAGEIHLMPGQMMAEITRPRITIIGKGGHGSDPKLSNNPITPASQIYLRYLKLIDKFKENGHDFNSTMPVFQAGSAMNVVPDKALLGGTMRSLEEGFCNLFSKELEAIVKEECERQSC